jgi:PEP-CTERM motif
MRSQFVGFCAILLVALFNSSIAKATSITCTVPGCDAVSLPDPVSHVGTSPGNYGSGSAAVQKTPFPALTATVYSPNFNIATAGADLGYFFQVVGPGDSAKIMVSAFASFSDAISQSDVATDGKAHLQLTWPVGNISILGNVCLNGLVTNCGTPTQNTAFAGPYLLTVPTNTAIEVYMALEVGADTGPYQTASMSGYLDPTIGFDPNFDSSQYGIAFSAGIGDAPAPLPASLPLFVSGLGALGLLGWRRKKKAQAVAA